MGHSCQKLEVQGNGSVEFFKKLQSLIPRHRTQVVAMPTKNNFIVPTKVSTQKKSRQQVVFLATNCQGMFFMVRKN